jgi:hypothetical protein
VQGAARRAFAEWNSVGCAYVRFEEAKTAACGCDDMGYDGGGKNANLVSWCEREWPADFPPEAIAITVVSYDKRTGEILDTDVAFNGVAFTFTATDDTIMADVQNTLTHEAGHMLGFGESDVRQAAMWGYSHYGDVEKRSLFADDIDGLCALYPVGSDPGKCASPVGGLADCTGGSMGCGCRIAGGGAGAGGIFSAAVLLAAAFGLRLLRLRRGKGRAEPIRK